MEILRLELQVAQNVTDFSFWLVPIPRPAPCVGDRQYELPPTFSEREEPTVLVVTGAHKQSPVAHLSTDLFGF